MSIKDESCVHQKLCKYFQDDELADCGIRDVCKHYTESCLSSGVSIDGSRIEPKAPKGSKTKGNKADDILKTFRKAKIFISLNEKRLNENQALAYKSVKGKHYSSLSESQVQQVIEIAADLERSVKAPKAGKR